MAGKFWTDAWSLVEGCTPESEGCDNCWLAKMERYKKDPPSDLVNEKGCFNGTVRFREDRLDIPLRARKPRVYTIWSELYHDGVTDDQRDYAFGAMALSPQHTFLIITKRPKRASEYHNCDPDIGRWGYIDGRAKRLYRERTGKMFPAGKMLMGPLPHIWHIVTAENQQRADERIPHLLNIPGKRGLIIEPMLGAVKLPYVEFHCDLCGGTGILARWPKGECHHCKGRGKMPAISTDPKFGIPSTLMRIIHQVILGPETGPGRRPMEEPWAQAVEEQCKAAGVPFFRKDQERGELAWRPA